VNSSEHQIKPMFNASVINNKASECVIQTTKQASMSKSSAEVQRTTSTTNEPCEVDSSIHDVSMKHSSKVIVIKQVWNQEFKQPSYKTLASVYNINNKQ